MLSGEVPGGVLLIMAEVDHSGQHRTSMMAERDPVRRRRKKPGDRLAASRLPRGSAEHTATMRTSGVACWLGSDAVGSPASSCYRVAGQAGQDQASLQS